MITLIENDISLEEYLTLREKVGWKKLTDKPGGTCPCELSV